MNERNYDARVNRWFDCVARAHHTFRNGETCMYCGALRRGPEVTIRGGVQRREKKR